MPVVVLVVTMRPEGLKGFDSDGYRFTADGSDEATWRFVRG